MHTAGPCPASHTAAPPNLSRSPKPVFFPGSTNPVPSISLHRVNTSGPDHAGDAGPKSISIFVFLNWGTQSCIGILDVV